MEWFGFAVGVIVATLVLVLPGLVVSIVLGFRGMAAWGSAAPLSLGVVAMSSLWAPLAGLRWSILPVGLTTAALAALAGLLRYFLHDRMRVEAVTRCSPRWATIAALAIGGTIIAAQVVLVIGRPENISQTFDNVFHLNAVRYVLETGSASPLTVGRMTTSSAGLAFYPSGWHAFVALIVTLTGASIPAATNALIVCAAAVAWVGSVVLLTRTFFRASAGTVLAAGVLSAAAASFPLLMIDYGVLYPYFLALCVLPTVVAWTVRLMDLGEFRPEPTLPLLLSGGVMLCGLAVTHPGALVAWIFVAAVCASWAWVRFVRLRPARRALIAWTALLLVFASVAFVAWRMLRPAVEARTWPPERTIPQALGEVLLQGMHGAPLPLMLAALFGLGVVVTWRSHRRAGHVALALYAVFAFLYVAVAAFPWPRLRDLLTAAWYNNSPRLAALIPLFVIPIAAVGAGYLITRLAKYVDRTQLSPWWRKVLFACVAALAVAATQLGGVSDGVRSARSAYQMNADSPLLTDDEFALLEQLPELVPDDAVIAGSPWTGTALAYAISDRQVLMRHIFNEVSPEGATINGELTDASSDDPRLCKALKVSGVEYVLDFGRREVHGAEHDFPGLDELRRSDNVRLVREIGDARLYEVTACGLG